MIADIFKEYRDLGLNVIPIEWDIEKKQPVSHHAWSQKKAWKWSDKYNALMIQTEGVYASIDFDIKNTNDKKLFDKWMQIVSNSQPEILQKVFIEQTKSDGYHVWIKYDKLPKKTALADSETGAEVIALYANGPLVYTYPTPGYKEFYQSMSDLELLNEFEYSFLIETSQYFNEYKPTYDPNKKAISYPIGYEQTLLDYDTMISTEDWEKLLYSIGLEPIKGFRYNSKDKFSAWRRTASTSNAISAKVYYLSKRVLIFSASLHQFPNWHNKDSYPIWALPPSFLLYYKLDRDWQAVLNYIGVKEQVKPVLNEYPYEIFPEKIRNSIFELSKERSLNPVFLASAGIWAVSSLAGNSYVSDFGSDGRNILFLLIIAPVSVGKTPAFKAMCDAPLKRLQEQEDNNFKVALKEWETEKVLAAVEKKPFGKPKPKRFIPLAVDGTTEGYIVISQDQEGGLGVYHDEAETIFNAGSFKGTNDSISFWTQAFSGGRFTQIRADRDKERVVKNLNLNLFMGTQPDRLKNVFTEDRISSGFASRFLMVESDYIELNTNADPFAESRQICDEWVKILNTLYDVNKTFSTEDVEPIRVVVTDEAKELYRKFYKENIESANDRIKTKVEGHIIGTNAKMSNYVPRLTQLIAIMRNPLQPVVTAEIVELGQRLYRYYCNSTISIINKLYGEAETGLPEQLNNLYNALPDTFTIAMAEDCCTKVNLKPRKFKDALRRKDFGKLFKKIEYGKYQKVI